MSDFEFVSLAEAAKKRGISEAVMRSRVLSGKIFAFVFMAHQNVRGSQAEFLPAWSKEEFPFVDWVDHGSEWNEDGDYFALQEWGGRYHRGSRIPHPHPTYTLTGWVALDPSAAQVILTSRGTTNLHGHWVHVTPSNFRNAIALKVRGAQVSVRDDNDSYDEIQGPSIQRDDLFFIDVPSNTSSQKLDARRERSLLRVIKALTVMAGLPARGAATAIERQLHELGLDGPNDETIRAIVEEARSQN